MENVRVWLLVLWVKGLVDGAVMKRLVTCANENGEIQLWCDMEKRRCSLAGSSEIIAIDPSSIQSVRTKYVFTAQMEGEQESMVATYSCESEGWSNMAAVSGPDPSPLAPSPPHPSINKSAESEEGQSDSQRGKEKDKKCKKKDRNRKWRGRAGKDSDEESDEDSREKGQSAAECNNTASDDNQRRGGRHRGRRERRPKTGFVHLNITIAMSALLVVLLVLVPFSVNQWKKRKMQRSVKAAVANDQILQQGDPADKLVTVYGKATNAGIEESPPVYNPTDHIYQEITDTPRDFSEVLINPGCTPNGLPSLQPGSHGQPPANGQYSLLQLPLQQ